MPLRPPPLHHITNSLARLASGLLPCHCLLCGASLGNTLLCADCELALPYLTGPHCESCALPLNTESAYCGQCLHHPPAFSRALIPFRYAYPLDSLLHRFKYRRQLTQGRALAILWVDYLKDYYRQHPDRDFPDLLVPVPMHWSRRLLRGFNQTEIMGWDLAKALGLSHHSRLCRRRRRTPAQSGLTRKNRQHNLHNAFTLASGARATLDGRRVALLDDVVTTTSTTRALSQLLLAAGAADVQVWALARTPEQETMP